MMTFEHLLNFRLLKFYNWIKNSCSPCIMINKLYLTNNSQLKTMLNDVFSNKYQIDNIDENDIDAINSRIFFVQNREEASWNIM